MNPSSSGSLEVVGAFRLEEDEKVLLVSSPGTVVSFGIFLADVGRVGILVGLWAILCGSGLTGICGIDRAA